MGCEGEYGAPGSMQDHWRKTGHPYDKVETNNFEMAMRKRAKETLKQNQSQNPAPSAAALAAATQSAADALGNLPVPGDNEDKGNTDTPFPSLGTQESELPIAMNSRAI